MSKDLVVLVADKDMELTLRGILARGKSLGIRDVSFDLYVHPERDPGCLNRGHDFLRPFSRSHGRALLLHDHEGCGRERSDSPEDLEGAIEKRLAQSGWAEAAAIVIGPELENWVWSDSPQVDVVLGWENRTPSLKRWLADRGDWKSGQPKPMAPKEAMEAAIRVVRKQRSSSLYADLAAKVSFERCSDRAFLKLKSVLQGWFGPSQQTSP